MSKICRKRNILMRDNALSHISKKTIELIKKSNDLWMKRMESICSYKKIENAWGLINSLLLKKEI